MLLCSKTYEFHKIWGIAKNFGRLPARRFCAALLTALLLGGLAAGGETPALPRLALGTRIECPGVYPGHLQGIATDGKSIYWVFSCNVVRTDLKGKLLAKANIPFHGGDPCWYRGRLYVPVGSDFNRKRPKGKKSDEWICEFDSDLKLRKKYRLTTFQYGAGGVAAHDGRFFVVGGRPAKMPGNTVWEYDARFKLRRRHQLEFDSEAGIQTINRAFGKWFLGCYGTNGCAIVADDGFKVVDRVRPPLSVGMIPLEDGLVLVGVVVWKKEGRDSTACAVVLKLRK